MFEVVLPFGGAVLVDAHDYWMEEESGDLVFYDEMEDGTECECGRFPAGEFAGVHTVEVE